MKQFIASFLNRAGDIEASVTLLESGNYAVHIIDVDAGERLPVSRHFKSREAAEAYALKCVTSEDDDELPF